MRRIGDILCDNKRTAPNGIGQHQGEQCPTVAGQVLHTQLVRFRRLPTDEAGGNAALRIARDRVDNLVSWEDLARFPERFRDVLERPSVSRGVTVYADVASSVERVEALALLAGLARDYDEAKLREALDELPKVAA